MVLSGSLWAATRTLLYKPPSRAAKKKNIVFKVLLGVLSTPLFFESRVSRATPVQLSKSKAELKKIE